METNLSLRDTIASLRAQREKFRQESETTLQQMDTAIAALEGAVGVSSAVPAPSRSIMEGATVTTHPMPQGWAEGMLTINAICKYLQAKKEAASIDELAVAIRAGGGDIGETEERWRRTIKITATMDRNKNVIRKDDMVYMRDWVKH